MKYADSKEKVTLYGKEVDVYKIGESVIFGIKVHEITGRVVAENGEVFYNLSDVDFLVRGSIILSYSQF